MEVRLVLCWYQMSVILYLSKQSNGGFGVSGTAVLCNWSSELDVKSRHKAKWTLKNKSPLCSCLRWMPICRACDHEACSNALRPVLEANHVPPYVTLQGCLRTHPSNIKGHHDIRMIESLRGCQSFPLDRTINISLIFEGVSKCSKGSSDSPEESGHM